jgi:hypothetical protein
MTHRDDSGNVVVDFVWGNLPMQPDDDRGGEGQSATLDPALDNHIIATTGYSNFPGFIPNYWGDEDSGLEAVIPNLVRKTLAQASAAVDAVNLDLFSVAHNLSIQHIESTGTTVRVYAYDTQFNNWGGGYSNAGLIGLREGDEVNLSVNYDGDPLSLPNNSKVTAINNDGSASWFEIKVSEAFDPALDFNTSADGTVYAGNNLVNVITMQRDNYSPGMIVDEYTGVHVRYFGD